MIEYRHIAVEGLPGAGKTAVARALADRLKYTFVPDAVENPFLEDFKADIMENAFKAQVYYLLSRFRKDEALRGPELFQYNIVTDYLAMKNDIYASVALTEPEFKLYMQVDGLLGKQRVVPDFVIYLQLTPKEAHRRASGMDAEFVRILGDAYNNFFFSWKYTPALVVKADSFDPSANALVMDDFIRGIERISAQGASEGVVYYSPIEAA